MHARALALSWLCWGLLCGPLGAQNRPVSKVGTTAAAFLEIGVGARAQGLGGAFVALANSAEALYWNPAGLAQLSAHEAFLTHSRWLAELTFDYLGVALRLDPWGTLGVSVTRLGMPEMLVRTEDRPEGTGEWFGASDLAVGLSYGRPITDRFSIGFTVKYIEQRIWHTSAVGFAADLGTQFRTDFFGGLVIGASITNFGTDMRLSGRDLRVFVDPDPRQLGNNSRIPANLETEAWSLPVHFQVGVATTALRTPFHRLSLAADAVYPSSNYQSLNGGLEYSFRDRLWLRLGYQNALLRDGEGGFSWGLGLLQPLPYPRGRARIDYAYRAFGRLGAVHVLSLGVSF
ncbi:MAG: PorV/PorQ family protein [Bacteroidetes bacterium]|nr:PorV/PorQ family protein [Rhodothermia bacterium]MCS7155949.1 PorV/PorQ family protein [Bacteroidota bacterium]MCX7905955.1 PorV/PorQ family protein [Bacteroidota bacterium]MDW8138078.1 PorV/PorQ family protein [Bacteroidota bacterium]MDW8285762.1 PorV/PorQ family protein [Bacteroidota bacterium]